MDPKNTLKNTMIFLIGLAITGLVTAAIILTFLPGGAGQSPVIAIPYPLARDKETDAPIPYPSPMDYQSTASAVAGETALPLLLAKQSVIETDLATTPSPTLPQTPVPTGTLENDVYLKTSGKLLGIITQNGWIGYLGGNRTWLYAGALEGEPEQGTFYLFADNPRNGPTGLILAPGKHGAVRVVAEQDNRLTLVSSDGTIYYYDLPARRFVDSLAEIVPSLTPLPHSTALPPPATIDFSILTPGANPYPAPALPATAYP
jgi:hypothetical protein